MLCSTLSLELAEVADGTVELAESSDRHVQRCLRCQAELAHYRKLLRGLTSLRGEFVSPDEGLLDEILAAIQPPATVHKLHRLNHKHRKVAYIGSIAAAGAAGAIVLAARLASREKVAS